MGRLKDKKYEEFCQQWIVDFNGARAARAAGFCQGRGARVTASKLLTRFNIRKRIAELLKDRSERTQITQDMVLRELSILGFSDFANYGRIKDNGGLELYPFDKVGKEKTRAIESIKETSNAKGRSVSLKLPGKIKPLELIGKHLGMFADTHNLNLTGDIRVITAVPRPKK